MFAGRTDALQDFQGFGCHFCSPVEASDRHPAQVPTRCLQGFEAPVPDVPVKNSSEFSHYLAQMQMRSQPFIPGKPYFFVKYCKD
ncbi:hypothetical protein [Argonema galeatum]|uniref:hypothetical protein n=1 Tax=Argonema galeatum TaxID=2942762 RepID=UPI0020127660|nr:hypothetical protein [Argonema galeatum]MCL1466050.1 hypothetical protein [Argonema galeatum A003/A1]